MAKEKKNKRGRLQKFQNILSNNIFKFLIILGVYLVLFIIGLYLGYYSSQKINPSLSFENQHINLNNVEEENTLKFGRILLEEALEKFNKGEKIIFIDGRTYEEYKKEHLKGAVWTGVENIEEKVKDLDKEATLITYCYGSSCGAASVIAQELVNLGFKNVYASNISVEQWKEKGGPTEKGE